MLGSVGIDNVIFSQLERIFLEEIFSLEIILEIFLEEMF